MIDARLLIGRSNAVVLACSAAASLASAIVNGLAELPAADATHTWIYDPYTIHTATVVCSFSKKAAVAGAARVR
jgi:hypothetical protein